MDRILDAMSRSRSILFCRLGEDACMEPLYVKIGFV